MSISVTPRGGAFTARGGWNSAITYYQDDFVIWRGVEYQSLLPVNTGNQPDTSSWAWIASTSDTGLPFIIVGPPSGDTSGATDAQTISAAINELNAIGGHGTILFDNGIYYDNQQRDFHGTRNVTLLGTGGVNPGGSAATLLQYVGTASPYINARSTAGFQIRDIFINAHNPGFTGVLVDLSHDSVLQTDSSLWGFERCTLGAVDTTTAIILSLDEAINGTVRLCSILGGNIGIQGIAVSNHYCNGVTIQSNQFVQQGAAGACISGPGQGWAILGNSFELQSGNAAIVQGPTPANQAGVIIAGNWFGDATGSPTVITTGIGWHISGNYIGGNANTTAIALTANSHSNVIKGNRFDTHSVGILLNSNAQDPDYLGNSYNVVTTRWSLVTIAPAAGAGTGATASVSTASSDLGGQFTVVSGTSTAAGVIATITTPSFHQGMKPVVTAWNAAAAALQVYVAAITNTTFTIATVTAIPAGGTTLTWNYVMPPVI